MITPYYEDDACTIYLGDCREIMPQLGPVDHVITDPPYSERTHKGHDASAGDYSTRKATSCGWDKSTRNSLGYGFLTTEEVTALASAFAELCNGWIVWMTDHTLAPHIQSSLDNQGRYTFAPIPFVLPGGRIRLSGDGPSSWTIWIVVARTAKQHRWGTLPGAYIGVPESDWYKRTHMGGKPLPLMTALVGDYSREGDTILDPFMGSGTTLRAAKDLGRKAIGVELEEKYCEIAARRLAQEVLL
jgi:DNA modification methylase